MFQVLDRHLDQYLYTFVQFYPLDFDNSELELDIVQPFQKHELISRLFLALIRVPGNGRTRAFLHGGARDAAFKLIRIATG